MVGGEADSRLSEIWGHAERRWRDRMKLSGDFGFGMVGDVASGF